MWQKWTNLFITSICFQFSYFESLINCRIDNKDIQLQWSSAQQDRPSVFVFQSNCIDDKPYVLSSMSALY